MRRKIKALLNLPFDIWLMFITYLPGPIGNFLRYNYWKKQLKYLGNNVRIDIGAYFQNPQYIEIDDNCWIDRNVIIVAGVSRPGRTTYEKNIQGLDLKKGEIYIGQSVHIAPNCIISGIGGVRIGKHSGIAANSMIYSYSHHYRNLNDSNDAHQYLFSVSAREDQQAMISGPVVIEDYCGVGLNSTLLPGTHLTKGSWVASHAVVSGEFPEQSLIHSRQQISVKSFDNLIIKE